MPGDHSCTTHSRQACYSPSKQLKAAPSSSGLGQTLIITSESCNEWMRAARQLGCGEIAGMAQRKHLTSLPFSLVSRFCQLYLSLPCPGESTMGEKEPPVLCTCILVHTDSTSGSVPSPLQPFQGCSGSSAGDGTPGTCKTPSMPIVS